jgi:hypothetical protein
MIGALKKIHSPDKPKNGVGGYCIPTLALSKSGFAGIFSAKVVLAPRALVANIPFHSRNPKG